MLFPLLRFALPTACFGCGRLLGRLQHLGACPDCWSDLAPLRPPLCSSCGSSREQGTDLLGPARGRCASCLLAPPTVDAVRAAVRYDALARRFLLRAKLERRPELLRPLGRQLARLTRAAGWDRGRLVVTPVPSHPWLDWKRGFRPSARLARIVAEELGLPWKARLLVRRLRFEKASKRLGAGRRRFAARRAFRLREERAPARVLLVDDVMTTGASINACAALLKRAGAAEVRAIVWARTPRRAGANRPRKRKTSPVNAS